MIDDIRGAQATVPMERHGLTSRDARRRLGEAGPNRASVRKQETFLDELLESLREPLVLLLLLIGVLYFILGNPSDAFIIFGVIIAVALAETAIEWRAGRAVEALAAMAEPKVLVWRDGEVVERPVEEIVPQDVVELRAGSQIPADGRLLDAEDFAVDESIVTGESEPVSHQKNAYLLGGTLVVRGRGRVLITKTGPESTIGTIAELVASTREPKTPMQLRMASLAKVLLWVAIGVSGVIPLIGYFAGRPGDEMILTGLSLAFATVPEELPVLIVVVLGLGGLRLAQRGAIVRRLRAAETLGAVTIICTDKTGTLTHNKMTVAGIISPNQLLGQRPDPEANEPVLAAASLASEPHRGDLKLFDPVERAIEDACYHWQVPNAAPTHNYPFDRARRISSGYFQTGAFVEIGAKGAAEAIVALAVSFRDKTQTVPLDEATRARLLAKAADYGKAGRILAVASRQLRQGGDISRQDCETDLVFEGLLILQDPIRADVKEAIAALDTAGVHISVITGDQASTAHAVAEAAGIKNHVTINASELEEMDDSAIAAMMSKGAVVARSQPVDKLRIVQALSAFGHVVMVTGDGVNDAPALRAAAVGVAMGRAGSDVARQAADVVLTNDSFATLVESIREGRRLIANFNKAICFYLAVKLALILVSAAAAILGHPLPFTPVQIVILELFMDLGAALAFVSQPADEDVMRIPPRDPNAPFFTRPLIQGIVCGGFTLALLVFAVFQYGLTHFGLDSARTLALISWFVGHAVIGLTMAGGQGVTNLKHILANRVLLIWFGTSVMFAALIAVVETISTFLGGEAVPLTVAAACALVSLIVPLWLNVFRLGNGVAR